MKNEINAIRFAALAPAIARISYVETTRDADLVDQNNSHVHPECEIYFNVSGDVSFMVEKRIHPISPGDIVITRPYEYHHCIYHSDVPHHHYCVLFTPPSDEHFLPRFFDRKAGEGNLLVTGKSQRDELTECLERLRAEELSECERYSVWLRILTIIESASGKKSERQVTSEIDTALDFIEKNYTESISVERLAASVGMSINTLERHFRREIGMSPLAYLKKKRLAHAARMLVDGSSVIEAAVGSGFSDYSYFIILFKETYGVTPLKYKKKYETPVGASNRAKK